MMPSIQLLTSQSDFERMALRALAQEINKELPAMAKRVEQAVKPLLIYSLKNSNEYEAIASGPMQAHFGFRNGRERMDKIISVAAESLRVTPVQVRVRGAKLTSGLRIEAIPADFAELLALPEATVTTRKGVDLPWLQWLLLEGDRILIADYGIMFGDFPNSRSGEAIMITGENIRAWKVPIGVSGTIRDNWLTRVVSSLQDSLHETISKAFT